MNDNPEGGLDIAQIKKTELWESLPPIHLETHKAIQTNLLLIEELRKAAVGKVIPDDVNSAMLGLELSLRDLIEETIKIGVKHAVSTVIKNVAGVDIEMATEFRNGNMVNDDDAYLYLNITSAYLNVQEKTNSLISMGWVDVFTKLRVGTLEEMQAKMESLSATASEENNNDNKETNNG